VLRKGLLVIEISTSVGYTIYAVRWQQSIFESLTFESVANTFIFKGTDARLQTRTLFFFKQLQLTNAMTSTVMGIP